MPDLQHTPVIIIGSGPAGLTAAVYAARAGLKPLLVAGLEQGGQLMTTSTVENWPGAAAGVEGPQLMTDMQEQAERFGTRVVNDVIVSADITKRPFILLGDSGTYSCDALIVATGASAKYLGLESETAYRGRGVSACATCDGFFYRGRPVVVVGGGNAALEEALYLSQIASVVHLVHRRKQFRAENVMVSRMLAASGRIIVHTPAELVEVKGDGRNVTSVLLRTPGGIEEVTADGVFIAIGHTPNTGIFRDSLELDDGYIVTCRKGRAKTATSVPGVFAAGDCADPVYRQAVTSAGSGCQAALDAQRYLETLGD